MKQKIHMKYRQLCGVTSLVYMLFFFISSLPWPSCGSDSSCMHDLKAFLTPRSTTLSSVLTPCFFFPPDQSSSSLFSQYFSVVSLLYVLAWFCSTLFTGQFEKPGTGTLSTTLFLKSSLSSLCLSSFRPILSILPPS
eukprot:Lithocolla_globosa_v1_NODE_3414_length_1678_cov_90.325940.p2 type:complete len:137 gc:universal NODE_3414_length_1678_cov_90.325940:716-306(-)